jgi:2-dehydropantoate 2-reductase
MTQGFVGCAASHPTENVNRAHEQRESDRDFAKLEESNPPRGEFMRHAVLGIGAIGGLIASALEFIGEDVVLLVRAESLPKYPERLTLEQPDRTITASAHAVSKLVESVDVLWIATKTYQLQSALEAVQTSPRTVVPLLNGVDHVAVLRSRFGEESVVPGTIAVEAERKEGGHFVQRSMVRLSLAANGEARLGDVLAQLQQRLGFICKFVDDEPTLLWTKLSFLAPFALVTTASGKDKGGIFADPEWKAALYEMISETTSVVNASGAEVDRAKVQLILNGSPATMRSSMLKDFLAGRELELDAIGGPIVRGGAKFGIPVPTTQRLMDEISRKVAAQEA